MSMLSDYKRMVEAPMIRSYETTISILRADLQAAEASLTQMTEERDRLREMVPTPLNMWAAKGYEIGYDRDGPGATPHWCLHLNGVGSVPIAWFYRKADAQRCIEAEARKQATEAERDQWKADAGTEFLRVKAMREALEEIAEITHWKGLPITAQINVVASLALSNLEKQGLTGEEGA